MQIARAQDRPIKSELLMGTPGKMNFSQLQIILTYTQVWVSYSLPVSGESI